MAGLARQLTIEGSRIEVVPGEALRQFVREDLFFEYPGLELSGLPRDIALVPFVWTVAPIAWAIGAQCTVDELDDAVVSSLDQVHALLRAAYPSLAWDGSVLAQTALPHRTPDGGRYSEGALFSGGLDSTYTALRHAGPGLCLISAWGADITFDDTARWRPFEADARAFAATHAGGLQVVRTNARSALDYRRLNGLIPEIGRWWVDVQFGTTLTGLAAPIAAAHGIEVVHFSGGAALDANAIYTHGSFPRLDNAISLGGARVHHEGAAVSRQSKISWIVASGASAVMRVCHDRPPPGRPNCGRCSKCVRTILGIVVAGGDPLKYGFADYSPAVLNELPARFERHDFVFGWADAPIWEDIRDGVGPGSALDPSLADWLSSFDFAAYGSVDIDHGRRSRALVRRVRGAAPWLAPVVAPLRGLRSVRRYLP